MSTLKKLIKKHCPNGVEYKRLGDVVTDVKRGSGINKDQLGTGTYPCVTYGDIYTKFNIWTNKAISFIDENLVSNKKFCEYGDLLITCTSENIQDLAKPIAYVGQEKIIVGADLIIIKHNQNAKYLIYSLTTSKSKFKMFKIATGTTIFHIRIKDLLKIKIPLPPLIIQEKIADILDQHRELERELKKELKLRKQQYEYYRDKLISEVIRSNIGPYVNLGNIITEIYRGTGVQNNQIGTGDYPCTTYGSISNAFSIWFEKCNFKVNKDLIKNPKYFEYGDLLFVCASQNVKQIGDCVAYLGNNKAIIGAATAVAKHKQNAKYLSYALSTTESKKQKEQLSKAGAIINITIKDLLKIKIPLPPLDIQEQIANKLDKFRNLCEDLTDGLPREILLNKQKYEYYRDKLIKIA